MERARRTSIDFLKFRHRGGRVSLEMPTKRISQPAFYEMLSYFIAPGTSLYLQEKTRIEPIDLNEFLSGKRREEAHDAISSLSKKIKSRVVEKVIFIRESEPKIPQQSKICYPDTFREFVNSEFQHHASPDLVAHIDNWPFPSDSQEPKDIILTNPSIIEGLKMINAAFMQGPDTKIIIYKDDPKRSKITDVLIKTAQELTGETPEERRDIATLLYGATMITTKNFANKDSK